MESEMTASFQALSETPKRTPKSRRRSLDFPAKFQDGEDAHDDAAAPKSGRGQYMNQSFISLIANVGSNAKFNSSADTRTIDAGSSLAAARKHTRIRGDDQKHKEYRISPGRGLEESKQITSERNMLRSLPGFSKKSISRRQRTSLNQDMSASQILLPLPPARPTSPPKLAHHQPEPVGPRIALHDGSAEEESGDMNPASEEVADSQSQTSLAERLQHIFGFENEEEVISGQYMKNTSTPGIIADIRQSILVGYSKVYCCKSVTIKSGFLSKRGRRNPKFNRYWFILKGDVLSYYSNPKDLYFPRGNIDLRSGVSATFGPSNDKGSEITSFSISTSEHIYQFRTDSAASAKEWVKHLQKVIFRSHNDGDSVKISLPINNILDIEENPVIDFADTFKIRVIDNDETYAIDEYFFSFFTFGKEALTVLRGMVEEKRNAGKAAKILYRLVQQEPRTSAVVDRGPDRWNAAERFSGTAIQTLVPRPPFEANAAMPSNATKVKEASQLNANHGQLSTDGEGRYLQSASKRAKLPKQHPDRRQNSSPQNSPQSESDLLLGPQSSSDESELTQAHYSQDRTSMTASQILQRDDVFQKPTILHEKGRAMKNSEHRLSRSSDAHDSSPGTISFRPQPQITNLNSRTPRSLVDENIAKMVAKPDMESQRPHIQSSTSSSTLHDLLIGGSTSLQRASGIAGLLRSHSKRMGSLFATESKGYYEKVSSMWAGKRTHYDDAEGLAPDDQIGDPEDEDHSINHGERFRTHFALPNTEKLQATYYAYLHRVIPAYGKIYVGNRKLCFRSLLPGSRTRMILPLKDIENVDKENGFRFGYSGLVLVVRGHEEVFFEFRQPDGRDDCAITILQSLESLRHLHDSRILSLEEKLDVEAAKIEDQTLAQARRGIHEYTSFKIPPNTSDTDYDDPQIMFDDQLASVVNFKPSTSLKITCLTIGSRGDVQPYIALCKGLMAEGHKLTIATHAEFEPWIRKHGIDFALVAGDPAEIMRLCVEHDMFTFSFLREAASKFREWIDELFVSSWKACQGADLLIESPSAMGGIHIAEALGIPYFRAFTMPWTTTRAYPHAFTVPNQKRGGYYNTCTYVMFDYVFWQAVARQVNQWRVKTLGLSPTSYGKLQQNKVPFLYNFSPFVVVPPLDFNHWIHITGYWFLDEGRDYTPPKELKAFIRQARKDRKKIVYVGFGSIVVEDPPKMSRTVIESVLKADVRCILSKGWSERLGKPNSSQPEMPLPPEIYQIKSAPHDWLFRQIDAAAHHGGAGTTGASLRAGIPTIIKPFFGDQFFFGSRVEDLGVGRCLKLLNTSGFARALWEATNSERMIIRARLLGEQIRNENGVDRAIQVIYRDLEYAKSLIKRREDLPSEAAQDLEDGWTMVEDESDSDIARHLPGVELDLVSQHRRSSAIFEKSESGERASRRSTGNGSDDEAET